MISQKATDAADLSVKFKSGESENLATDQNSKDLSQNAFNPAKPPRKSVKNPPEMCIDCDACTKSCEFLTKYDINLLDFSKRADLAYNCFLCDKCYAVCPKDISGNEIALNLRAKNPKPFRYLQFLKSPYLYANNSPKKVASSCFSAAISRAFCLKLRVR